MGVTYWLEMVEAEMRKRTLLGTEFAGHPPCRPRMDPRRFLLTSLAGALAAPRVAQGQQTKVARIGIVSFGHRPAPGSTPDPNEGFRHGLRELGYEEGRSIILEYRYAEQQSDRLSGLIADLIRMSVDVLHVGGPEVVRAALSATTTIPIVMVSGGDPVVEGLVQSLARPGGNLTGLTVTHPPLFGKRLELLKEAMPRISCVFTRWHGRGGPGAKPYLDSMSQASRALGLTHEILMFGGPDDLDSMMDNAVKQKAQALQVNETATMFFHRERIARLAATRGLPVIGMWKPSAQAGYLMTYDADLRDLHRRAAIYVDKILKGAKPPTSQSSNPRSSSWLLTSRPPRLSASRSRRHCWRGRIR
jgi:ABC-type uncharacterized transport system substrate-binding protein